MFRILGKGRSCSFKGGFGGKIIVVKVLGFFFRRLGKYFEKWGFLFREYFFSGVGFYVFIDIGNYSFVLYVFIFSKRGICEMFCVLFYF